MHQCRSSGLRKIELGFAGDAPLRELEARVAIPAGAVVERARTTRRELNRKAQNRVEGGRTARSRAERRRLRTPQ
jgi:hypothetical protein